MFKLDEQTSELIANEAYRLLQRLNVAPLAENLKTAEAFLTRQYRNGVYDASLPEWGEKNTLEPPTELEIQVVNRFITRGENAV